MALILTPLLTWFVLANLYEMSKGRWGEGPYVWVWLGVFLILGLIMPVYNILILLPSLGIAYLFGKNDYVFFGSAIVISFLLFDFIPWKIRNWFLVFMNYDVLENGDARHISLRPAEPEAPKSKFQE